VFSALCARNSHDDQYASSQYYSDGAPVRGYIVASIVSAGCVLIGELNLIAPLVTMFFMMTYALINFACAA
jgi:solute carrier family 12 sodium/potassium/chloride transporter 2